MDMEREAKRNRVDKEMKVAKKIVDRKAKQTRRWQKRFDECMEREKLWKWTFDKKYKAIMISGGNNRSAKKTKRNTLNESFTGTNQSPADENMQEDSVEQDNLVDKGVGQVDQSVDETFSIVDNTFEEEQASQEQASVTFTEPDSVPQTAIKPEDDRSRNNVGTTRAGATTADQT